VLVVTLKLGSAVWIAMGHIGGAGIAWLKNMLHIPSIDLNSGKMDLLKRFHCATWTMFLSLVTQALVVHVGRTTIYMEIES